MFKLGISLTTRPARALIARPPSHTNQQHRGLLSRICKTYEGYAAVADDGSGGDKIVGVSYVDVHAKGSKVATLGPVASVAPGAGRKTVVAACEHAEKLGFSTLVRLRAGGLGRVSLEGRSSIKRGSHVSRCFFVNNPQGQSFPPGPVVMPCLPAGGCHGGKSAYQK